MMDYNWRNPDHDEETKKLLQQCETIVLVTLKTIGITVAGSSFTEAVRCVYDTLQGPDDKEKKPEYRTNDNYRIITNGLTFKIQKRVNFLRRWNIWDDVGAFFNTKQEAQEALDLIIKKDEIEEIKRKNEWTVCS